MMKFRIDFIQGKTNANDYGQMKHSLADSNTQRKIISLKISSEKLQSVSNYSREPRRLVFECFPDNWITDNILTGANEHERYVSHYEVKAYRDEVLMFSGIIDTSQLSLDASTEIISITCYDKIKLLSLWSDLTHYYSLTAGYYPAWILGYFLQDIIQMIPINVPYINQLAMPSLLIPSDDPLTLVHVDYDDMLTLPVSGGSQGWNYTTAVGVGWAEPYYGYRVDVLSNVITFVFGHYVIAKAVWGPGGGVLPQYQGRFRGKVYRFYNGICPVMSEYDDKTGWTEDISSLDSNYNELIKWFADNSIPESVITGQLTSAASLDGRSYSILPNDDAWIEARCHGNVFPSKIQPGKSYETFKQENTDNIRALQGMLMLCNATIFCDAAGRIILKNKDAFGGGVVDIDDDDVVRFVTKRGNHENPDMSTLDVLAGDTSLLKPIIKDHLVGFYDSLWSCEVTIDGLDNYNLTLQGMIKIRGKTYGITEVERDFVKDEYKVKAWLI